MKKTIPAFPNVFPYNELLLTRALSAKTRTWRWNHTGLTLLYTSTGTDKDVAKAHFLDPKDAPRGVLVGVGELIPVRGLTKQEHRKIIDEFYAQQFDARLIEPRNDLFRYKFQNLKRFKKPIPFKPPKGAMRTFKVPVSLVRKSLREIGIIV